MRPKNVLVLGLIFAWLVVVAGFDVQGALRQMLRAWFTESESPAGPFDVRQNQEESTMDNGYRGEPVGRSTMSDVEAQYYGPDLVRRYLANTVCVAGQLCTTVAATPLNQPTAAACEIACGGALYSYFQWDSGFGICECLTAPCTSFASAATTTVYAIDSVRASFHLCETDGL